ncbi:MAG: aspartate--tRNA ligase [Candidatus Midichloria mitochondrii]|uniref:Aspartate--tRNA(Asp/Asn) ligase n=1 Tax=Midichloria mitochondrii (strain IricVA) TaxID=696127 RepID=F7XTT8_MIDMI|nr:aspartate--tRNA ligase [Candidatus Midichloria mitochondrii]AEI89297.1 aspartyl-tRNA synthetase [Candidatus Midichloria mitochondrii IricVA]MDJ1256384.1 aspartate--tRNA ligase [Candidatus Midichloria mitochondrii]MDJ1288076.1 aspartate--tRNA ligase [Candidatus Midichloria mitochondrii]MDJ1298914.1 aspartate--tRNA ligase [Candidatus Midichloria mitochondrii]MDJ1313065.1 aspartate--tRNA ligase [Candidatus Midichloria mitochondrii]
MHKYRTHHCNELSSADIGQKVRLSGWVHRKRDHGGVFFIDLRDHYGITQIVTSDQDPELIRLEESAYAELVSLSYESVITITGTVLKRSDETVNGSITTGRIEVLIEDFSINSKAEVLPLNVNSDMPFPEDIRLKYRFLDLRREKLHKNIVLRNQVIRFIREKMHELGFNEFQTPILTASSPEGARDFLVPSRLHYGMFYALPQAPQQFKQLLMISGFDRYFQIAPCFRDEDARADRAPGEFYQLDVEMSFVTQEDVFATIEPVLYGTFKNFSDFAVTEAPFPRIKYADAMLKFGSDKPDLRNPIVISDVTDLFKDSGFAIFKEAIDKHSACVRAIPAPQAAAQPRSFFDKMVSYAQTDLQAKGLAYIVFGEDGMAKGPIVKFLNEAQLRDLKTQVGLQNGDAVFFICEKPALASKMAGHVRTKIGQKLDLLEKDVYKLCWIIDFPFYEWNEDEKRVDFSHNPFSMPQGGIEALEAANTVEKQLALTAYQYDIVCNGIELSSGAIRNHKPEIMYKAFSLVDYDKDFVDNKFGAMIKAFTYGAPPHGGIAPGIDRIVMLLANEPNIREVIAFPLNQNAQDLLMGAPSSVTAKQLKELNISVVPKLGKKIA